MELLGVGVGWVALYMFCTWAWFAGSRWFFVRHARAVVARSMRAFCSGAFGLQRQRVHELSQLCRSHAIVHTFSCPGRVAGRLLSGV